MAIRWGILGCGDIVRKRVAGAIQRDKQSSLVAACRRDGSELREFCQSFGVERAYTRDADLLNDPEIDAVYVATPVRLHAPQTIAAAQAGKHVLVEKPMARTAAECDPMIEACQRHGVKLGVAYYRRFYPAVARIRELLASGEIGQLMSISAITSSSFGIGLQVGDEGFWRMIRSEAGGGALMDIGSHRIDLFLDLCGAVSEVRAYCESQNGEYDTEDRATLLLRFETGVHGMLQCLFGTHVKADELSVVGTEGRLIADSLNSGKLVVTLGNEQRTESHPPAENLHGPLITDFVDAILENRAARVSGEEGQRTNEVIDRAYGDAAKFESLLRSRSRRAGGR